MKILIDISNIKSEYEGVAVYALNILKGFKDNKYTNILILAHPQIYKFIKDTFPEYTCIKAIIPQTGKHLFFKEGLLWSKQINNIECDIIFSPAPHFTHLFCKQKIIQTIHDLQPLALYKGKDLILYKLLLPLLLLRSHKLITISNFIKNNILQNYSFIKNQKIQTIYNSVITYDYKEEKAPVSYKYLLYISNLWEYKNVFTLVKAFNIIKEQTDYRLVIIGRNTPYWENTVSPFITKHNLKDKIIQINSVLSNDEIAQFYKHASLFIHPSLMEGFGYPPIEAAIYETPVLTTKETCLYETTQGLLNYYSPAKDEVELAKKIMMILQNPPTSEYLKSISEKLKQEYNYKEQAKKIYQFIISQTK